MVRTVETERRRLKLGKRGPRSDIWTIVPGLNPAHWQRLRSSEKYAACSSFQHILIAEGIIRDKASERKLTRHRLCQERQRKKIAAAVAALGHVVAPNKTMIVAATLNAAIDLIRTLHDTETKLQTTLAALKSRQRSLKSAELK